MGDRDLSGARLSDVALKRLAGSVPEPYTPPPRRGLRLTVALDLLTNRQRIRRAGWPTWKWVTRITEHTTIRRGGPTAGTSHMLVAFLGVTTADWAIEPWAFSLDDFDASDWEEVLDA